MIEKLLEDEEKEPCLNNGFYESIVKVNNGVKDYACFHNFVLGMFCPYRRVINNRSYCIVYEGLKDEKH